MSLSLSKKAIILVAVPLAFEIVFVISLAVLLQQVGIEREKENRARELTTHVNAGLIALMDRFSSCILYHVSDSPIFRRRFDLARDRIKAEISYMRGVVVDSPEDRKRLETIEDMLIGSGESLQRAQGQLEQGDKIAAARQWVQADRAIGKLLKAIDEISQSTQLALDQRKAAQEAYVRMVEQLLIAGVLFNILLAVALALSFNRGTSNRLKVLVDNTLRLAANKPLSAPLSGSDEIAKLDGTFREMAEALEESRIKERAVVDNAADVICSVDRSGILEVNPAASRLWGYSREELVGKRLSDFVVESERRATEEATSALMSGGEQSVNENRIFENRIVTKDGPQLILPGRHTGLLRRRRFF
jgi:PAS domain S-box-containing protein